MQITENPKIVEVTETVIQEETFTVVTNRELLLFIARLFGKMSGPKEKACGLSEEAGSELAQFYYKTVGHEGIESLKQDDSFDFDAKIVKQSDLCGGCR